MREDELSRPLDLRSMRRPQSFAQPRTRGEMNQQWPSLRVHDWAWVSRVNYAIVNVAFADFSTAPPVPVP